MPVGSTTTADGITTHGEYAFSPPASFFAENNIPEGTAVYIPQGLVADPSVDNRPAIQAAIDQANADGGGVVYIPPGVYGVGGDPDGTGSVLVKDNVFLKGAGMGETVLRVLDHVGERVTGIVRSPFGVETNNWGVSDISLDGNRANNDEVLEHVDGFFCGGKPGETITDHDVTLLRVEIYNCSGYGFDPHERTERLLIDSSVAHHNGKDGFVADYIIDGEYRNNLAYENDRHGFNLTTTTNDFVLHDNIARDNGSTGIVVQRGDFDIPVPYNIVIRDNEVSNNGREGILVQMGNNILITNNAVDGSGKSGIRVYGGNNVTVSDNDVTNSSQNGHDGYPDVQIREYDDTLGVSGRNYPAHDNLIENNHLIAGGPTSSSFGVEESAGDVGGNVVRDNEIIGQVRGLFAYYAVDTTILQKGTDFNDGMSGNDLANKFYTAGGDDVLKGNGGDDWLNGGTGADSMSGGTGDDVYFVDNIGDIASEKADEGHDRVLSSVSFSLKSNIEFLRLTGHAAIDGTGNNGDNAVLGNEAANVLNGKSGDDLLLGNGGSDSLIGGDGDDLLNGGAGADSMTGGKGNDRFIVDNAGDIVIEKEKNGYDTIFASVDFTLGENIEALTLAGTGARSGIGNGLGNLITGSEAANRIFGEGGSDRLFGMGGRDIIVGGKGADFLDGGASADRLMGGLGADSFYFGSAVEADGDSIADFNSSEGDKLDFSMMANGAHLTFIGTQLFTGSGPELRIQAGIGGLRVIGDTDGDGGADFDIHLVGVNSVLGTDFIL